MQVHRQVRTLTTRSYTWRKIGPVVVLDEAGQHAMEAADMSKTKGTEMVPTVALDRPEARGFKVAPETDKESPQRYVGIVARKATGRTSAGKKGPIRINPDRAKLNIGINNGCTTFVMKHKANSMKASTSKPNQVWYVNSGSSNHMTNHDEWFSYLEKPVKPRVVETGDDTPHSIEHVGEVPLRHVGQREIDERVTRSDNNKERDVSRTDRQLGMQIRFTHLRCLIGEEGQIIAQARREGRMFILEINEVGTTMFAKGQKVKSDIDVWHKQFSHVNFLQLREMQTKNIFFRLPKFSGWNYQVCEAC